ncbi:MAG: hypothetical protein FOGNACKC_01012 [Anaerolineae bacterium]|nr:hypothetical protein [Anaerolineae bacterium]
MSATFEEFQAMLQTDPAAIVVANINVDRDLISKARAAGLYVFIGKSSKWGNPYQVAWDGSQAEIIGKYRQWLQGQPKLLAELPALRGKVLGCYCKPRACHGDILAELAAGRGERAQ